MNQIQGHDHEHHGDHDREVHFTVDGEKLATARDELTPQQIMVLAQVDPATHYLVQIEGRHRVSYQDDPETPIKVHNANVFVTVSTGPTAVS